MAMDRYWVIQTGLIVVQVWEVLHTLRDIDTTINQDDLD
jgi:hypothetical protein